MEVSTSRSAVGTERSVISFHWCDYAFILTSFIWLMSLVMIQSVHSSIESTDVVIYYFPAAWKLMSGWGIQAFAADVYRGPGYPVLLALASLIWSDLFSAGKVVATLSSEAFLVFSYLLIRRVFNPQVALAAALMTIGTNTFAHLSAANFSDLPFAALAMASLYLVIRKSRPGAVDSLIAGVLAGLAFDVRWTGLGLPLAMVLWLIIGIGSDLFGARSQESEDRPGPKDLWRLWPRLKPSLIQALSYFAIYLLGFLIASGPWFYVNALLHGSPLYNEGLLGRDTYVLPLGDDIQGAPLGAILPIWPLVVSRFVERFFLNLPMVIQGFNSYPAPAGWILVGDFWILTVLGLALCAFGLDRLRIWLIIFSAAWWASLVPIHFEPRYYILLLPVICALSALFLTGGFLPDLWLLLIGGKGDGRLRPGLRLDRGALGQIITRISGRPDTRQIFGGLSFLSLVALGILVPAVISTADQTRRNYEGLSGRDSFYREIVQLVRPSQETDSARPVAVRAWSQARYWIPSQAGVAVVPLVARSYDETLPDISYVLYDQIDPTEYFADWWDDLSLRDLKDPLLAPANLEPVYYKPDYPRAALYRVLDRHDWAKIGAARASSEDPVNPVSALLDNDPKSAWIAAEGDDSQNDDSLTITLELRDLTRINHLWLMPAEDASGFPLAIRMEVSLDGNSWLNALEKGDLQRPLRQSPLALYFEESQVRYVRLTLDYSAGSAIARSDQAQGGGAFTSRASLAEVRLGLVSEKPALLPALQLVTDGLSIDAMDNGLQAIIHNPSSVGGSGSVAFSEGWDEKTRRLLGFARSAQVPPGGSDLVKLGSNELLAPELARSLAPNRCLPIWAAVLSVDQAISSSKLRPDQTLETYGIRRSDQANPVFQVLCSPNEVAIDDFKYRDSPLTHGWRGTTGDPIPSEVMIFESVERGKPIMRISVPRDREVAIRHDMAIYDRTHFRMNLKSMGSFILYLSVIDEEDNWYNLQYIPGAWESYSEEYPNGHYITYVVGSQYDDGSWHLLERNLSQDFTQRTGKNIKYIQSVILHAWGDVQIEPPRFAVR